MESSAFVIIKSKHERRNREKGAQNILFVLELHLLLSPAAQIVGSKDLTSHDDDQTKSVELLCNINCLVMQRNLYLKK
ncbi:MAG: hypothetical protein PVJ05_07350 [Candidatus Thorarchaeota archaeon]|jgi:hypothetical protein